MSFRSRLQQRQQSQEDAPVHNDQTMALFEEMMGKAVRQRSGADAITVPDGALIPLGDGALQMGGYRLTKVGVTVDESATYDQWEMLTKLFAAMEGAIQWILGDLIAQGETVYGQTYEQIASLMNREVTTLYDYVYVASNVEFSVRTENLSFGHHKLVASKPEDEQREWLAWATENNASVAKLRAAINGDGDGKGGGSSGEYKPPRQVTKAKPMIAYTLTKLAEKPPSQMSQDERDEIRKRLPEINALWAWINEEFGG